MVAFYFISILRPKLRISGAWRVLSEIHTSSDEHVKMSFEKETKFQVNFGNPIKVESELGYFGDVCLGGSLHISIIFQELNQVQFLRFEFGLRHQNYDR